jgi:hypothetical protein
VPILVHPGATVAWLPAAGPTVARRRIPEDWKQLLQLASGWVGLEPRSLIIGAVDFYLGAV